VSDLPDRAAKPVTNFRKATAPTVAFAFSGTFLRVDPHCLGLKARPALRPDASALARAPGGMEVRRLGAFGARLPFESVLFFKPVTFHLTRFREATGNRRALRKLAFSLVSLWLAPYFRRC